MTAATQFPIVTPGDLGPQFFRDPGTNKFRLQVTSADADNIAVAGADGGSKVTAAIVQAAQITYTAGYDSGAHKITLYKTQNGATTIVSTVDPSVFDVSVSGATLNNGKLTLTESNGGPSVVVDLNAFLSSLSLANGNAIALSGSGQAASPLTATFVVDGRTTQLLKVGVNGAYVDNVDVLAFLNACTTIMLGLVADDANGVIRMKVGNSTTTANSVVLTDARGNRIGSLFA